MEHLKAHDNRVEHLKVVQGICSLPATSNYRVEHLQTVQGISNMSHTHTLTHIQTQMGYVSLNLLPQSLHSRKKPHPLGRTFGTLISHPGYHNFCVFCGETSEQVAERSTAISTYPRFLSEVSKKNIYLQETLVFLLC